MFKFLKKNEKKSKNDKKVVIIGLDGVPHSLLLEYTKRGFMPEFASLINSGNLIKMNSTLPEVSSVAWSSFMTGKNPGEHGIFGFMGIDPNNYDYIFPIFNSLKVKPMWERLNLKTVAFNIPQTYPARDINGVMVSGFVAIDLKKSITPDRVYNYLKSIGYKLDVNAALAKTSPKEFIPHLFDVFNKRVEAIEYLYDNEEWQLFIGTITETDRLHHYFYDNAYDGEYYQVFKDFYTKLDSFIGKMAKKAKSDGAVFATLSDHGFTAIKSEVYINKWLIDEGFLSLDFMDALKGINDKTRAFCLDPSRVYIHLKDKYKRGSVDGAQCGEIVDELKKKLLDITFDGQKVVKKAFLKDDIFTGPFTNNGPDIYLLPEYGFDLKAQINKEEVFGRSALKGMHTYDDAHFYCSEPVNSNGDNEFSIVDVLGTVYKLMNYK